MLQEYKKHICNLTMTPRSTSNTLYLLGSEGRGLLKPDETINAKRHRQYFKKLKLTIAE